MPAPARARPFDLKLSENVEAIAISIAMALILKFFIIEAYQIPTGSMQPTILGDRATGIKDRVLADKLLTMLRDPLRWEVMIFRFPLDERRLYVKRIVGLPGETLEVEGGDIWIDGRIARKPDHVNESVLKHVAENDQPMDVGRWFTAGAGVNVSGTLATFSPDSAPGEDRILLRTSVMDDYIHGYDPTWGIQPAPGGDNAVADLDVSFVARLDAQSEAVVVTFESDEGECLVVLPRQGSSETARLEMRPTDGDAHVIPMDESGVHALPTGREVEILARNVDRQVLVEVDGEVWVRFSDDVAGPRPTRPRLSRLALAMPGGGQLSGVVVRRDIYYLPKTRHFAGPTGRWEIPEDSYFGMGDNTQFSHDSRTWETMGYTLEDGTRIEGFWFPPPVYGPVPPDANPQVLPDGRLAFADTHGDTRIFSPANVVESESGKNPAPFIHERYLLGKAGLVFWPVVDPFRWKLIR